MQVDTPVECVLCGSHWMARVSPNVRGALVGDPRHLASGMSALLLRSARRMARQAAQLAKCASCGRRDAATVIEFWTEKTAVSLVLAAMAPTLV